MNATEPQVIPGLSVCLSIFKALHMAYESGAPNLRLFLGGRGGITFGRSGTVY